MSLSTTAVPVVVIGAKMATIPNHALQVVQSVLRISSVILELIGQKRESCFIFCSEIKYAMEPVVIGRKCSTCN